MLYITRPVVVYQTFYCFQAVSHPLASSQSFHKPPPSLDPETSPENFTANERLAQAGVLFYGGTATLVTAVSMAKILIKYIKLNLWLESLN